MEISTPKSRMILTEDICGKQCQEHIWQIYTTEEKSLVWSIFMSYLFSTSKKVTNDNLHEFLDILQYEDHGEGTFFQEKVLTLLLKFNPFINRDFYSNSKMKNLVKCFAERLEFFDMIEDDRHSHNEQILQSASTLLRCRIDVYNVDDDAKKQLNSSFFKLDMCFAHEHHRRLILFRIHKILIPSNSDTFSFGISPESACFLRKRALIQIAEKFEIPDEVSRKFLNAVSKENDFLIQLILRGYSKDIWYLFRSPLAIQKLSEACLNIDPRKTDSSGYSAFYYCMGFTDASVLYLLYNYSTGNIFIDQDDSLRKPNSKSLETLKEIGNVIKTDFSKSNDFLTLGCRKEFALKSYRQLLQFNKYQISIIGEIVEICNTENDEFMKQLYIMVSTLYYYNEYFYIGNASEENMLNNYIEFAEYYDNLDYFNHILFFDNIVSASTMADENNKKVFMKAVTSSFLLILARKMFPRKAKHFSSNAEFQNMDNNYLQFIPLTYRIEFRSLASDLSKELIMSIKQKRKPNTETFDVIRQSLWELPEVKNELIATRIKKYLSTIVKPTREILNSKKALVMERILQVIGELICSNCESDCVSNTFLCCWFPNEMESALGSIRNHCFSHYRANSVQGRLNLEFNEFESIERIQKEMVNVNNVFVPITECFMLSTKEFMIKKGLQCSQERHESIFRLMIKEHNLIVSTKVKHFQDFKKYYTILSRNVLRYISQNLEKQKIRHPSGENKNLKPKLKDKKFQFEALIFLSNYITECLQDNLNYSTRLKRNTDKLNELIKNHPESDIQELKEDIECILREAGDIYDDIWNNYKVQLSIKNMKTVYIILKVFIIRFYTEHVPNQIQINFIENEMGNMISLTETILIFFSQTFENESSHTRTFRNFKGKLERLAQRVTHDLTIRDINILIHQLQFYFKRIRNMLNALDENPYEISFNSDLLNSYFNDMKDHVVFSQEEENDIKRIIYEHLIASNENKKKLQNRLQIVIDEKTTLEYFEIQETLKHIVMNEKKRNYITYLIRNSKHKKALKILTSVKNEKPTKFKSVENMTLILQKIMDDEKHRIMFLRITFPPNLQKKINQIINQKFHLLIIRIKLMKKFLIDDDAQIKEEWTRPKNNCEERHMKIMMRKKYVTENETKAALEMLLFDCLNVLQNKDLEELWEKKCNLFSGTNLRDFLSHGSPLTEKVANCLDPNDFPMEFINKIIELINDNDIMNALLELWEKSESRKFSDLRDVINMNCDDEYNSLRRRIKSSNRTESDGSTPRWEKYLKVLNLDTDTSTWS